MRSRCAHMPSRHALMRSRYAQDALKMRSRCAQGAPKALFMIFLILLKNFKIFENLKKKFSNPGFSPKNPHGEELPGN